MSGDGLDEFNKRVLEGRALQMEGQVRTVVDRLVTDSPTFSSEVKPPGEVKDAKMWAVYDNTFSPCERAVEELSPGQYLIEHSPDRGYYFSRKEIAVDDLMQLPDSAAEEVIAEIETFWTKEEHFREFGFLWKRGVMLWGPPGSGKTSCLQMVSKRIVEKGGLAIYLTNPEMGAKGLEILRKIEPDRPIIVMIEDIDAITESYGEAAILALLDGELQIDNVVFVATTNYPERLDKRLINRPSRFDIIKLIDMPSEAARQMYITAKNKRLQSDECLDELETWVSLTGGFSLAHLKELIVAVEVFEAPLEQSVKRLRTMMKARASSDQIGKSGMGF